jgi:hypothetical protein
VIRAALIIALVACSSAALGADKPSIDFKLYDARTAPAYMEFRLPNQESETRFFGVGAEQKARITAAGAVTCYGEPLTAAQARAQFKTYAGIYLALCNPPRKEKP